MFKSGVATVVIRALLYGAVFFLVFRLNQMTDFTADDFIYHFHFQAGPPDESTRLLAGVADIPSSIVAHHNLQNGRSVAHAILQLFFLFDKSVFNVVNALMFVALGPLVMAHIVRGRGFRPWQEALVFLTLWLFIPYFGQAALWMSGAVNYVWMSVLTLVTLLAYRLHDPQSGQRVPSPWWALAMLPVGFAAGNANENSGGAWILLALFFIGTWLSARARVPLWAWAGVLGAIGGLALQLVSPGNRLRAEKLAGTAEETTPWERIPYLTKVTLETSGLLFAVFAVLLVIVWVRARRFDADMAIACGYVAAGLASGAVMAMTPTMPHRSWLWTVLFLMVAIGILARAWPAPQRTKALVAAGLAAVLCGWGGVVYAQAYRSIAQTHAEVAEELRVIEENKARGNLDVVVTKFRLPTNKYNALAYTGNLRDDPNHSFNRWFARYYGLNSITIDNPDQMYR